MRSGGCQFGPGPGSLVPVDAHRQGSGEATRRGVQVLEILDKSQRTEMYSSATFLANARIRTLIDDLHVISHNKIMVIDGRRVITGSFNFTKAAEEKNAENLLVTEDGELAAKYTANWKNHERHAARYERLTNLSR